MVFEFAFEFEFEFEGKVGLVTGANRGIGACFVDGLMEAGASKVYACARTPESLNSAVEKYGDRVVPLRLDVTDPGQIDEVIAQASDVDLVISNAGRGGSGSVLELDDAFVRTLFEVHVFGPRRLIAGLIPGIVERKGGVILVQSTAALAMSRGGPMYSASKSAATFMGMGLREEMRQVGVKVSNIHPGFTNTEIIAAYEIAKAEPRDVVDAALAGWANDEAHVFTDLYSQMVHEQLLTEVDALLFEPVAAGTDLIAEYRRRTNS
jgi:NAD(P)-dependent dehydrogenase (short-subunit alcohol dehydrogenase family)